jgi:hypothetical protein
MMPIRPDPDPQYWVKKKKISCLMATRYGTYMSKIVVKLNCRVFQIHNFLVRIPRIMSSDPASDTSLDIF